MQANRNETYLTDMGYFSHATQSEKYLSQVRCLT